jgi:hypothetical protein
VLGASGVAIDFVDQRPGLLALLCKRITGSGAKTIADIGLPTTVYYCIPDTGTDTDIFANRFHGYSSV